MKLQKGLNMNKKHFNRVQMINDNYYIIHDLTVREKYPILFKEVCEHDRISTSSWYSLSDEAYEEYQKWCNKPQ